MKMATRKKVNEQVAEIVEPAASMDLVHKIHAACALAKKMDAGLSVEQMAAELFEKLGMILIPRTMTCIKESALASSLGDYDFGVLPGNTALQGLGEDYASRIVFSEDITPEVLSLRANGVAVRPADAQSAKTKAIVEAFADARVSSYISKTFGESVVYHYENLLK